MVTLTVPPHRIVSTAPSNTEILFALGLGPRIVGDTDFCDYPMEARRKQHIGGIVLNMEKIVALHPDVVVAVYDLQKANIARMEALGQKVFAVNPHSIQETIDAIKTLGRLTGTADRARQIERRMVQDLAEARRIAAHAKARPRVLAVIQSKPLIVVGPQTFMDDALRAAGAHNVAADVLRPYPIFSEEAAVSRRPDVILLANGAPENWYRDPAWRTVPAIRNRQVLTPSFMPELERPGPRLTAAVVQLVSLLYPERQQEREDAHHASGSPKWTRSNQRR